ncbi:MAG: hypothetical protein K9J16_11245 [Melioribacteraceae bacterium]|nr:hypothetical protein [Melioribacteraceae bacterium]MCF8353585.1 hypothetical protein [Melioribacteraceae bacterium]MCF8393508.1 hypothetical protein [Melioribacteraceae bacterium]MCF8419318.1 hypothetical protein [Melioribacteraceae bacterium]
MAKTYILIFAICLFFVQPSYSQSLVYLFNEELPELFKYENDYLDGINTSMEAYGKLNPDLLYFYILQLSESIWKNERSGNVDYKKLFKNLLNNERVKRNNWVNNEIEYLINLPNPKIKTNELKSFLNNLSVETKNYIPDNIPESKIDSNKLYYCSYIYLIEKKSKYADTEDYKSQCKQTAETLKDYFENAYNNYEKLSQTEIEHAVEKSLDYLYLFKNNTDNFYGVQTSFRYSDFLSKLLSEKYKLHDMIKLRLSLSTFIYSLDEVINIEDNRFPYILIENDLNIDVYTAMSIGVGYRFVLKEDPGLFSYLDFDLMYLLHIVDNTSVYPDSIYREAYPLNGKRFRGLFKISESDETAFAIAAQVQSPLYYFNNRFFIGAGVQFIYSKYSVNYLLHKRIDYLVSDDPEDAIAEDLVTNVKKEVNQIRPMIFVQYDISKYFTALAEYVPGKVFNVGIQYNYELK